MCATNSKMKYVLRTWTVNLEREKLDYIFLDFENLPVQTIPDHSGIERVFLFAGEKQKKVTLDVAESMQKLGSKAKLIKIKGSGNNALDFHIAYYIGKYAEIYSKTTFKNCAMYPLCIHMNLPYDQGWQLVSVIGNPGLAALTCAKTSRDRIFSASLIKFKLFHLW